MVKVRAWNPPLLYGDLSELRGQGGFSFPGGSCGPASFRGSEQRPQATSETGGDHSPDLPSSQLLPGCCQEADVTAEEPLGQGQATQTWGSGRWDFRAFSPPGWTGFPQAGAVEHRKTLYTQGIVGHLRKRVNSLQHHLPPVCPAELGPRELLKVEEHRPWAQAIADRGGPAQALCFTAKQ